MLRTGIFQRNPQIRIVLRRRKHNRSLIFKPVWDFKQVRPLGSHPAKIGVVHIKEDSVCRPLYIIIKFTFGLFDSLKAAEPEQMGLSHISNQPVIGQRHGNKLLYVTGMARPHLYNRYLST